jgi:hypothetical protein
MPKENLSLDDLERLLSQRLEEIQRLQQVIEQRKAQVQLDELTAMRQQLEEQLKAVNDKIAGGRHPSRRILDAMRAFPCIRATRNSHPRVHASIRHFPASLSLPLPRPFVAGL